MSRSPFQSLHFKIASGVIATVLVVSTIYFAWDYSFYRRQLFDELEQSAESVSGVTLNSLIELAMLGEHPELLQDAVAGLASVASVGTVDILDRNGTVRISSEPSRIGESRGIEDPECRECHKSEPILRRTAFIRRRGTDLLRHVSPIPNHAECQACHDSRQPLIGLLVVDFPVKGVRAKLEENFNEMLVKAAGTVLVILAVLGLLLNRLVIGRLKRLTAAATSMTFPIGEEESEAEDEIGKLARSFGKMADQLRENCRQLEEKERIRVSLLERLVHSQEEERKSLSRELHDDLGQSLSALLLAFQVKFEDTRAGRSVSEEAYRDFEERINGLIERVRRLAWQMRPSILDDYGLQSALERYIAELSPPAGLTIDFQQTTQPEAVRVPPWVEVTLYRVSQEALTNVLRHSDASRASVVLIVRKEHVTLLIDDNGKGFDSAKVISSSSGGLGLAGMKERVTLCGGTFEIESKAGKGTTLRVRIPLVQEWQSVQS